MATSRHPVQSSNQQIATSSVPMRQDSQSFEERQKMIWDEMHERMERRRREWDDEVCRHFKSVIYRAAPKKTKPLSSIIIKSY